MSAAKRILIVAATWEQVPLIAAAKARGLTVVATDPNPEAEGLKLADEVHVVDPRNLPAMLDLATRARIDGVTADECDYSHFAAVYVATRLGLPNDGLDAAALTTNKRWMREAVAAAGSPQPRFMPCHLLGEAKAAAGSIGYPVVVKPVDNRGAFGVTVVRRPTGLEEAFHHAQLNAHSREILVEEHISGTHITIDGCVDQCGLHHNLAVASKAIHPGDKPVITKVVYPAEVDHGHIENARRINTEVVRALGIRAGLTHAEYIVEPDGRCMLVEMANRGGGVLTSARIVPTISGVDVTGLLLANALGEPFTVAPRPSGASVVLKFFVFQPGTVSSIEGLDEALQLTGVMHVRLLIKPGDRLTAPDSAAGRHGFALLRSDDSRSAEALLEKVLAAIRILYAD